MCICTCTCNCSPAFHRSIAGPLDSTFRPRCMWGLACPAKAPMGQVFVVHTYLTNLGFNSALNRVAATYHPPLCCFVCLSLFLSGHRGQVKQAPPPPSNSHHQALAPDAAKYTSSFSVPHLRSLTRPIGTRSVRCPHSSRWGFSQGGPPSVLSLPSF